MADGDDVACGLRNQAMQQPDTITRQLQREILGERAAEELPNDALDASRAAEAVSDAASSSAKAKAIGTVNDARSTQEHKTEEAVEDESHAQRRRTLSPSQAVLLQLQEETLDTAMARRDTVSPETLKAVLRADEEEGPLATEQKKQQKKKSRLGESRNGRETSKVQEFAGKREDVDGDRRGVSGGLLGRWPNPGDGVHDSPARSTRSKTTLASKRPRSTAKKTLSPDHPSVDGCRKSMSIVDTSDSFTDLMFAPNLLEQDAGRRTTLDPTEAAAVVSALQKEMRPLNGSALEMGDAVAADTHRVEQEHISKIKAPTPPRLKIDKKVLTSSKESKNSPNKSRRRKLPSPSHDSTHRKSPSSTKEVKGKESQSPTKSDSMRRATVDPIDALVMVEGISQLESKDDRRQTIDEHGLFELTSAQESPSAVGKDPAKELSRKRASDADTCRDVPEKRGRPTNDDQNMESMDIDSPLHAESELSPHAKDRQKTSSSNQRSPVELPSSLTPKPSLFSPPPEGPRVRTPLKGILSARKLRPNDAADVVQTTPNKSVNFGPSQGAEFNHGSPSTSMTPMLAKEASRLFPLKSPASSEEELDDAETSLNTSILDEADSVDEKEPTEFSVLKTTQLKKPGFDLLQSRRNSFLALKSTEKSRRRHSVRGYSPLDSQTEARRRRRQTINVTRQTSNSVPATATSFTANENLTASSRSPPSTRNSSFSQATTVLETSRMPYADSSASSDAGEDMEITGDYSQMLGRDIDATGKQSTLSAGQPHDEDTAEFSLGHLLAESSVYELTKSVQEPDHHDLPGSLGDLVKEVEASGPDSLTDGTFLRLNTADATLDPIQEKDETMTSSRGHSMMSLDPNESDEEYTANLESLEVNLKTKFDRVSTIDGETDSQCPACPKSLPVHLITMEALLASVALEEQDALVGMDDAFFCEEAASSGNQISRNVKLACAYDTCSKVVERHVRDVSSWSVAVTEELTSLLNMKAPAVFSPEFLDDAGRKAIQQLYATEAMVAQTNWCQLQAQVEKQLVSSLSVGADVLANDVKSLKDCVSACALKRQNELAAIKEMIDREEQMVLLLDAIEEQQGAHDEYASAVQDLEKECSSLSLEESVLQSRLRILEGRAAELEPVTSEAASVFEQEVLATEEMLAIQESMSVWKIREATTSALRLSARFEDVLFDVEVCVNVHVRSSLMGGTSPSIKTNEVLKHNERSMYLPYESDVVLVLQRLLLDPHYISQIAEESDFGDGHMLSKLQILEHFINRSFRLLKELRELSTRFTMRYNKDDSTLWVDFLKFPSAASHIDGECVEFSVGFSLLPVHPYTDYQTAVQVPHGQVSCDAIAKEIELVSRHEPKYFTRVCRQLHASFVR